MRPICIVGGRMWRSLFLIVLVWCAGIGLAPGAMAAEPVLPTTLDETFRYADTNITEIRAVELFLDGRIAYGGVGPSETAGIAKQDGSPEWLHNFAGSSLSVTRSVAVDATDGAFYIGGLPRASAADWAVERMASGTDNAWTFKADVDRD